MWSAGEAAELAAGTDEVDNDEDIGICGDPATSNGGRLGTGILGGGILTPPTGDPPIGPPGPGEGRPLQ